MDQSCQKYDLVSENSEQVAWNGNKGKQTSHIYIYIGNEIV